MFSPSQRHVFFIAEPLWPFCPQYVPNDPSTKWKTALSGGFTHTHAHTRSTKWHYNNVISIAWPVTPLKQIPTVAVYT